MELFYVGDTVQIKVGTWRGNEAVVQATYSDYRARVAVGGSAAGRRQIYSARSLTLIKSGLVRLAAEADAVAARVEDVAAEVAANPGPIVRDPEALQIGDRVRITVGNHAGVIGDVISTHSGGRLGVSIDNAAPKIYGPRSLFLVRAAAHIKRGDTVVRKAEPDGPRGVVQSRGPMRLAVEWAGMPATGIDARAVERVIRRPEDVAAEVAALARPAAPAPAEACAACASVGLAACAPSCVPTEAEAGYPKVLARYRRGSHCPTLTSPEGLAAHEASHAAAPAARPDERVYPIGRPEGGEDARFKTGLWMSVVNLIEAHGFPLMSGQDAARVQSMLFRFIYDDGE